MQKCLKFDAPYVHRGLILIAETEVHYNEKNEEAPDFTALRAFYLCQWGIIIKIPRNVRVKYHAIMFRHVQRRVA